MTKLRKPSKYCDFVESYFYCPETDTETDCLLGVTHIVVKSPNYSSWDSDVDYYGYREVEFDVLNMDKTPAVDIEAKATKADRERWSEQLYEVFSEREYG